jgi:hypothetical protein
LEFGLLGPLGSASLTNQGERLLTKSARSLMMLNRCVVQRISSDLLGIPLCLGVVGIRSPPGRSFNVLRKPAALIDRLIELALTFVRDRDALSDARCLKMKRVKLL